MPRDLTDLFEHAVRTAPPEPHHAGDITRRAERRQQRRTTILAAGTALVVVAVAGGAFGLTRGHDDTNPEPAAPYKHDQTVEASSAVPASRLPGYRLQPWTVPSVQHFTRELAPLGTYQQIDAEGRLIVEDSPGGNPQGSLRIRLFDGPGQAPQALRQPPSPGSNSGRPISWIPSFLADGRLLWYPSQPVVGSTKDGFHLTDLGGGNDVFVPGEVTVAHETTQDVTRPWVSGDRFWFTTYDSSTLEGGTSYSLDAASFSGEVTKVADDVAVADVADGIVGWITTDGRLVTESATGGTAHTITVPLSPGCRMPSTADVENLGSQAIAISSSVIALSETCGRGNDRRDEMLAFDLAGHLLVHVTGVSGFSPSLGHDDLVFRGLMPPSLNQVATFRYDLVTGTLVRLGALDDGSPLQYPQAAGDYVLWYDAKGGHVGEFTG
jgi:hypothetical protein